MRLSLAGVLCIFLAIPLAGKERVELDEHIVKKADTDKDGALSGLEINAAKRELIVRMRASVDKGSLTIESPSNGFVMTHRMPYPDLTDNVRKAILDKINGGLLDTDGDKQVSKEELAAFVAKLQDDFKAEVQAQYAVALVRFNAARAAAAARAALAAANRQDDRDDKDDRDKDKNSSKPSGNSFSGGGGSSSSGGGISTRGGSEGARGRTSGARSDK